jgi:osmoprotectant transport system substrate-binding protein
MKLAVLAVAIAALVAGTVSACGGTGEQAGQGGSIGKDFNLKGAHFTVGSKEFTEQVILGKMTVAALQAAGANVTDQTGLVGSSTVRQALQSGRIDMYWEYTGTAWVSDLHQTKPIPDSQQQYQAVANQDLAQNHIAWLSPTPFNDTYALAANKKAVDQLGVHSMSDIARLAHEHPDQATFCVDQEFSTRDDGLPGVEKAYGFSVPPQNVVTLDQGVIFTETAKGQRCNFGQVDATDARSVKNGLTVLQDDKNFFPKYNGSLSVRQDVLNRYPQLRDLEARIASKLDYRTMVNLNSQVDVQGKLPDQVAKEWLKQNGFIG